MSEKATKAEQKAAKAVSTAMVLRDPPLRNFPTAVEVAELAKAAFESKLYNLNNVAQARIKIQTGIDMGLAPTEALRNVYVVGATPSFSAQYIAAKIKASRPRYNYRLKRLDLKGCEVRFFEDGEEVGTHAFTEDDAKAAGLIPAKPDSPWNKYRKAMFFSRAITSGARIYCPDVLGVGLAAYTPEELGDRPAADDVQDAEFTVVDDE